MSDLRDLCSSNIEFGVDLYHQLSASVPDSNIFFSPMSISLALAMTSLGAKDKTEAEIKAVLKLDKLSELHPLVKKLVTHLMDTKGEYVLHIANRLYGEKSYNFLKNFLDECEKNYGAGLEAVDFINKARECESMINKWVENQTNEKIKNLIPSGTLNGMTKLVLVNAIYFKGAWKTVFDEANTKEDSFYITESNIVKVPLMHFHKKKFNYIFHDKLNCQILELPYKNYSLSFIAILPDLAKTNLFEVEKKLTGEILHNISSNLENRNVHVWLPKFKLETKPDILAHLKTLGIKDLFDLSKADLSKMNGAKGLYVSAILHKAFVEVNEKGSEAAAATAVVMKLGCGMSQMPEPEPEVFRADHPFIFLIKDNESGAVLFMGKLMIP